MQAGADVVRIRSSECTDRRVLPTDGGANVKAALAAGQLVQDERLAGAVQASNGHNDDRACNLGQLRADGIVNTQSRQRAANGRPAN